MTLQPSRIISKNSYYFVLWFAGLLFVLLINGSLPFVMMPTLGQAIWTTGFAKSFANEHLLSIYSHNFGYPQPAPIVFGLSGALISAVFIMMNIHPSFSYVLMTTFWLGAAYFGAYKMGRLFYLSKTLSVLMSTLWLSLPIIWGHAGYSMLSLGVSLLPTYLYFPCLFVKNNKKFDIRSFIFYFIIVLVSIFMDGYSFMLFTASSTILILFKLIYSRNVKVTYVLFALHLLIIAVSYVLYTIYIGKIEFAPSSLDFFRGWSVDLVFFFQPTRGIHWFWDTLGLSIVRTSKNYFGDASVWNTTFIFPLLLTSILSLLLKIRHKIFVFSFILIFFVGIYFSLGPSLKINSKKPINSFSGQSMPKEYTIFETGNSWILSNLPGFRNMRASYRWSVLGFFGLWMILICQFSNKENSKGTFHYSLLVICLIILYIPNIQKRTFEYISYQYQFQKIDTDLIDKMKSKVSKNEKIVFLPFKNDFLVNYLAPSLQIKAYNIGGDKNIQIAKEFWPKTLVDVSKEGLNELSEERIKAILINGVADAVILPHFDTLVAAHSWTDSPDIDNDLRLLIEDLQSNSHLDVDKNKLFTIIRFNNQFKKNTRSYVNDYHS